MTTTATLARLLTARLDHLAAALADARIESPRDRQRIDAHMETLRRTVRRLQGSTHGQ